MSSGQRGHAPPILLYFLRALIASALILLCAALIIIALAAIPKSFILLNPEYFAEDFRSGVNYVVEHCRAILSICPPLETFSRTLNDLAQSGVGLLKKPDSALSLHKAFKGDAAAIAYALLAITFLVHVVVPLGLGIFIFSRSFPWLDKNIAKKLYKKTLRNHQDPIEVRIQRQDEDFNKDKLPSGLQSGLTPRYLKETGALSEELRRRSETRSPERCYLRIQYLNANDHPVREEIRDLSEGGVTIEPEMQGVEPIKIVQDWENGVYIQSSYGQRRPLEYGKPRIVRRDNRGGVPVQHYALTLFGNMRFGGGNYD